MRSTIPATGAAAAFTKDREEGHMALCERLIEERDRLEQRLAARAREARAGSGGLADQGDSATREHERETNARLGESNRRMLEEVNRAIAKFQSGTYGLCEGTGQPIDPARLRACPWARYSAEYQEALDSAWLCRAAEWE
jgi:DnaK suppressor protein